MALARLVSGQPHHVALDDELARRRQLLQHEVQQPHVLGHLGAQLLARHPFGERLRRVKGGHRVDGDALQLD